MKIKVRGESGYGFALEGLSYNKNSPMTRMKALAEKLAGRGEGHDKFLRQIVVWIEIKAPRYWWQEMDQYKVGTTTQSESTMNSILKKPIDPEDFEYPGLIPIDIGHYLEQLRLLGDWQALKQILPESYLQKRMWCGNYAVLYNIFRQRKNHRLPQWRIFIDEVMKQIKHPELLEGALK